MGFIPVRPVPVQVVSQNRPTRAGGFSKPPHIFRRIQQVLRNLLHTNEKTAAHK